METEKEFERAYSAKMADIDKTIKHYEKEAADYLKRFGVK